MSEPVTSLPVAIGGVGLWMPGYGSATAWAQRAHDPEEERPTGRALARGHRRRAGTLARALADASAEAMEAAERADAHQSGRIAGDRPTQEQNQYDGQGEDQQQPTEQDEHSTAHAPEPAHHRICVLHPSAHWPSGS